MSENGSLGVEVETEVGDEIPAGSLDTSALHAPDAEPEDAGSATEYTDGTEVADDPAMPVSRVALRMQEAAGAPVEPGQTVILDSEQYAAAASVSSAPLSYEDQLEAQIAGLRATDSEDNGLADVEDAERRALQVLEQIKNHKYDIIASNRDGRIRKIDHLNMIIEVSTLYRDELSTRVESDDPPGGPDSDDPQDESAG